MSCLISFERCELWPSGYDGGEKDNFKSREVKRLKECALLLNCIFAIRVKILSVLMQCYLLYQVFYSRDHTKTGNFEID